MHIKIAGIHVEITDALRDYIHERLDTISKYTHQGDNVMSVTVEISKTTERHTHGDMFQVDALLKLKKKEFHVTSIKGDVYSAIDDIKDLLSRELTEYKDKQFSLFKRGASRLKKLLRLQDDA